MVVKYNLVVIIFPAKLSQTEWLAVYLFEKGLYI